MHGQLCSCVTCVEDSSYLMHNTAHPQRARSLSQLLRRAISSLRTRSGLLTMTREGKVVRLPRM